MASDPEDKPKMEKDMSEAFQSARSGARRLTLEHLDSQGLDNHMKVRFQQQARRRVPGRRVGPSRFSLTVPRFVLDRVREEVLGTKPEKFGVESVEECRRKRLSFALGRALDDDDPKDEENS